MSLYCSLRSNKEDDLCADTSHCPTFLHISASRTRAKRPSRVGDTFIVEHLVVIRTAAAANDSNAYFSPYIAHKLLTILSTNSYRSYKFLVLHLWSGCDCWTSNSYMSKLGSLTIPTRGLQSTQTSLRPQRVLCVEISRCHVKALRTIWEGILVS